MKKLSNIVYWTLFLASLAGGLYVGGWVMFIQPIIEACKHFDAGTLTGLMVGTTVLKCIFASAVGGIIVYVGSVIAALIAAVLKVKE